MSRGISNVLFDTIIIVYLDIQLKLVKERRTYFMMSEEEPLPTYIEVSVFQKEAGHLTQTWLRGGKKNLFL